MKICFRCNIEKPLTEYYKHKKMADGHLGKCKNCTKLDSKKQLEKILADPEARKKEQERQRTKQRKKRQSGEYSYPTGNIAKTYRERYKKKYPEKIIAKDNCQSLVAPEKGLEKHHWSYNPEHWKIVIWLTRQDHMKAHRFIIYDQERMMYRRIDNMQLLDTKDSHEDYIKIVIENEF